ncbi:major facilitator superfamily domain-containing protein [Gongronella butleri]|nr:major facilitator superfamily domain-containing protein [Gongronella butleri]
MIQNGQHVDASIMATLSSQLHMLQTEKCQDEETEIDDNSFENSDIVVKHTAVVALDASRTELGDFGDSSLMPGYDPDLEHTPQEEMAVRRKIDLHLMTFLCVCNFFMSMDRTNVSSAISDYMPQQLGFDNTWTNDTFTVFYVVFAIFAVPSNMIVKRVGAHRWIPILMTSWSIVTWCHCFVKTANGYMAVRVFIAITEAGFVPACLFYLSLWYKSNELPERLAWFFGVQTFSSAVAGLLAYALFMLEGKAGLYGWQWLFFVDGIATQILGLVAFFYLPFTAAHTGVLLRGGKPWLTERQVRIAVTRIIRDDASKKDQNEPISKTDIKATLMDSRVWVHLTVSLVQFIPQVPIFAYFPSMIRDSGFDKMISTLLTIPSYFVSLAMSIFLARSADKRGYYAYHTIFACVWFLAGVLALELLPDSANMWSLYAALLFTNSGPSYQGIHMGWASSNIAPVGKRSLFIGAAIGAANLSGVPGAQIYQQSDYPHYHIGNWINVGLAILPILLLIYQHCAYVYLNRVREKKWSGMTDKERQKYLETTPDKGNDRLDYRFII